MSGGYCFEHLHDCVCVSFVCLLVLQCCDRRYEPLVMGSVKIRKHVDRKLVQFLCTYPQHLCDCVLECFRRLYSDVIL